MANDLKYSRSSSLRWISRPETNTKAIRFLSFEISSLMSKLLQLWNRLDDDEFTRVKKDLANSPGIRNLVSEDEQYLTNLFLKEIVDDLQYIARSITRFANRCSDPVLHEFEKFVKDPIGNDFQWFGWQYRWKKMERRMNKMQRFVRFTAELSDEFDSLAAVERSAKRSPESLDFFKYKQKLSWHRRRVRNLQELSPWNRSFDYILRLFMRSIITIIERIKVVFEVNELRFLEPRNLIRSASDPPRNLKQIQNHTKSSIKLAQIRSFKQRTDAGKLSKKLNYGVSTKESNAENQDFSPKRINGCHYSISSFFTKDNSRIPPPSTLGDNALAVHYAKIIILVEKFAIAPHLIDTDERDALYNKLPAAMREALRSRLKSGAKIQLPALYDPVVAGEWKSAVSLKLQWLAPMAHSTEKWHSERSLEKHQLVWRSQALLVQTLHYANMEKTEAALMELLVALNNICSATQVYKKKQRLTKPNWNSKSSLFLQRKDEFALDSFGFGLSNSVTE